MKELLKLAFVVACLIFEVSADLTVYCIDNNQNRKEIIGGLPEYQTCTNCDCYVFELLCLEPRPDDSNEFYLYSRSYYHSKTCAKCTCNSNQLEWTFRRQQAEGVPNTLMVPLPPYEAFAQAAALPSVPNYAKSVISYITQFKTRQDPIVNIGLNSSLKEDLPEFQTTLLRASSADCSQNVQCDLMYDTDWAYRLRVDLSCDEAVERDPCFATNACLCSNGYFQVSEGMPAEIPASYSGDTTWIKEFKETLQLEAELEKKAKEFAAKRAATEAAAVASAEENKGIKGWEIVALAVILIVFVTIMYYTIRMLQRRQTAKKAEAQILENNFEDAPSETKDGIPSGKPLFAFSDDSEVGVGGKKGKGAYGGGKGAYGGGKGELVNAAGATGDSSRKLNYSKKNSPRIDFHGADDGKLSKIE